MPDDAAALAQLHRDLADIKASLARMEERIVAAAADAARNEAAHATVAARVDDLRARLDRAEGSIATFRWLAGLGGGAGAGALLWTLLVSARGPDVPPSPVGQATPYAESVRP